MNLWILASFAVIAVTANKKPNNRFENSVRSFSEKIYKVFANSSPDNFLVSPLSSDLILALVLNGAYNRTADQLAQALSLPKDLPTLNQMVQSTMAKIHDGDSYRLKTVNMILVNKNVAVTSEFATTTVDIFKCALDDVDFKNKQEAVNKVNSWVASNTDNCIKNLLSTRDITSDTQLVLLNALFFEGIWRNPFRIDKTTQKWFRTAPKKGHVVHMMEQTNYFEYFDDPLAQLLKMSYQDMDVEMIVVLPKEKFGLSELECQIENFLKTQNYEHKNVHVLFPKFTIDINIKMKPMLTKAGVVDLFNSSADLRNLSEQRMFVSEVLQHNYIDVHEKGTTVSSATSVHINLKSTLSSAQKPIEFVADHPFMYFIRSPAGILFIGRYSGPFI